jgi:hypothetical protein
MTENEFWNIDELVALTTEVQTGEVEYNGKVLNYQYCELTEGEEPKFELPASDAGEDESNAAYQKIGQARIVAMIEKANKMNPEGATVSKENWGSLPSTVRWGLSNAVLNVGGGDDASFRQVDD